MFSNVFYWTEFIMACGGSTDSDAYYRCYKALHLVTHEAIPCVDNCLKVWHANQTLAPCTTGNCPQGKKPRQPASCQSCVDWGNAVEGMLYQPLQSGQQPSGPQPAGKTQITWSNVVSSKLFQSHVEAAKAFVLRLPKRPPTQSGAVQTHTSMADFDPASLLMIMTRFKDFHGGDHASYQSIQRVISFTCSLLLFYHTIILGLKTGSL